MGSLFKKPKMPKPEAPIPMPDPEEVARMKRRNNSRRAQGGRVSTLLSDPLGGG